MKKFFSICALIFIAGCVQEKYGAEADARKQMVEAEQFFDRTLSRENVSALYPNRLVLEKGFFVENWPAFFNAGNEEIGVKIAVECDKEFDIEHSSGYFKAFSFQHRSFAVKLKATEKTGTGFAICEVKFIKNDEAAAKNGFVVEVK